MEYYLTILDTPSIIPLIKIRTRNHFLSVEYDSWGGIDISERKCTLCNLNDVGDEIHYILKCPFFKNERKRYIDSYYYRWPNILRYRELMTMTSRNKLIKLSNFIKIVLALVRPQV